MKGGAKVVVEVSYSRCVLLNGEDKFKERQRVRHRQTNMHARNPPIIHLSPNLT